MICFTKHQFCLITEQNTCNLRKDLTTETSLMSELDKQIMLNTDLPPGEYTSRDRERNVNLLGSQDLIKFPRSGEQLTSWVFQGSIKSNRTHDTGTNSGVHQY